MNSYQKLISQISVKETAVDCSRCSAEWKCCTYRPFIANFLVGEVIEGAVFSEELFQDWDFLITGLSPSLKYRKYFLKKGKWGFGTDSTLLCSFYEKRSGGCRIWQARPAVCRTFFCKSSYFEEGALYWKKAEEFAWHLEWTLLEDFLFTKGWTMEDIKVIKNYLDEKSMQRGVELPDEFRLADLNRARVFYKEAQQHVSGLDMEYVHEILGEHGALLSADLLAGKDKLR